VWRGDDPVAYGRILAALRDAGVDFEPLTDFSHLSHFPDLHRPGYSVAVRATDYERVTKIIENTLKE
jgi:hypothetical protein